MEHIDFKRICDSLLDAIYVTDGSGNTVYVNDAYCKLGNINREEIIGQNIFNLNRSKDLYSGGVLPEVLSSKQRCERVGTMTRTNKKVHITGIPLFDKNDNIIYAIATEKDIERLEELKDHLAELRKENSQGALEIQYLRDRQIAGSDIVAESQSMQEAFSVAKSVAATDVTVLITGESGTGKEILADAIYLASGRNGKPFIKLNCSAIPANLLESELFGYEEGSFTGALKGGKPGLFEIANGGVVLLDEIGDMPVELQAKLLRVLQSHQVTRIGGKAPLSLDIRLIASTNKDLKREIQKGTFREDLYYRLNVVPIVLKPLTQRPADIEPLVEIFLKKYNGRYNKKVIVTREAMAMMLEYPWPGNIRELKNVVERMVVINFTNVIDGETVSRVLGLNAATETGTLTAATERAGETGILRAAMDGAGGTGNLRAATDEAGGTGTLRAATDGAGGTGTLRTATDEAGGTGTLRAATDGAGGAGTLRAATDEAVQLGTLKAATESVERQMIRAALSQYGSKRKAATALGVDHSTLVKKCQRLGI